MIEITLADGTVADVPEFGPSDYYNLLRSGVKNGGWTDIEGTLTLLRLIAGEMDEGDVPGADRVENRLGTGVVNHALDLLEDAETSVEAAAEIERLLAVISPDRAALDAVSLPVEVFSGLRDDLTVRLQLPEPAGGDSGGNQGFDVVINAHGEGEYTADGEVLTMLTWLEVTDDLTAFALGGQVVIEMDAGQFNASFFGQTGSGEAEIGPGAEQTSNESAAYTCSNTTLELTRPEGTVRFFRVEEIPPTEVPTEFPEGNPEP